MTMDCISGLRVQGGASAHDAPARPGIGVESGRTGRELEGVTAHDDGGSDAGTSTIYVIPEKAEIELNLMHYVKFHTSGNPETLSNVMSRRVAGRVLIRNRGSRGQC